MPLWALPGRRRRRLQNAYKTCVIPMIFVCFRGRLEPVWEAWRRCPGGVRTSSGQRSDSAQAASGRRRIRRQPTPETYTNHWCYKGFISIFKPASMASRRHPGRRLGGVRVASRWRLGGVQAASRCHPDAACTRPRMPPGRCRCRLQNGYNTFVKQYICI